MVDIKTAPLNHVFSPKELKLQCKTIFGGVSWPGKRPGFAVIIGMSHNKHLDNYDIYLLEEFESVLGPLGDSEFNDLKTKNALGKNDLFEYIDSLTELHIITQEKGLKFKYIIREIFGEEKTNINMKNDSALGSRIILDLRVKTSYFFASSIVPGTLISPEMIFVFIFSNF